MNFNINELVKDINELANKNGFWDDYEICTIDLEEELYMYQIKENIQNALISQKLMLVVSELGEAMETLRKNGLQINNNEFIKDSFSDEIADAIIRLFDLCGQLNIDIEKCIKWKHEYNKSRPYKHGKQF